MAATIHQINISDGGVPKLPIPEAEVTVRGVVGDRQADLVHHGSPDQALCLYSFEVIEGLQAEGHPIEAGSAGENLTIIGLDWSSLTPGSRLEIGPSLVAELTWPAAPCSKNAQWFLERDFRRMSHDFHPGWSRWYARVLTPGRVRPGDPVEVEIAATAES